MADWSLVGFTKKKRMVDLRKKLLMFLFSVIHSSESFMFKILTVFEKLKRSWRDRHSYIQRNLRGRELAETARIDK